MWINDLNVEPFAPRTRLMRTEKSPHAFLCATKSTIQGDVLVEQPCALISTSDVTPHGKQQETNQPPAVGNFIQDKLNRELTKEALRPTG